MFFVSEFSPPIDFGQYWTDLRGTGIAVPGEWKWGDATALSYDPWQPGQPGEFPQDRVTMSMTNGLFWASPQETPFHFICEK